jgi:hypothetical protein
MAVLEFQRCPRVRGRRNALPVLRPPSTTERARDRLDRVGHLQLSSVALAWFWPMGAKASSLERTGGVAKWSRRRSAKPLLSGSSPDAASNLRESTNRSTAEDGDASRGGRVVHLRGQLHGRNARQLPERHTLTWQEGMAPFVLQGPVGGDGRPPEEGLCGVRFN